MIVQSSMRHSPPIPGAFTGQEGHKLTTALAESEILVYLHRFASLACAVAPQLVPPNIINDLTFVESQSRSGGFITGILTFPRDEMDIPQFEGIAYKNLQYRLSVGDRSVSLTITPDNHSITPVIDISYFAEKKLFKIMTVDEEGRASTTRCSLKNALLLEKFGRH